MTFTGLHEYKSCFIMLWSILENVFIELLCIQALCTSVAFHQACIKLTIHFIEVPLSQFMSHLMFYQNIVTSQKTSLCKALFVFHIFNCLTHSGSHSAFLLNTSFFTHFILKCVITTIYWWFVNMHPVFNVLLIRTSVAQYHLSMCFVFKEVL